jgi:predicted hydrocarbon binding protein
MEENPFLKLIKEGKIEFTPDGKIIGFNEYSIFLPVRVFNKLFVLLIEKCGKDKAIEVLKELGSFQVIQAFNRYLKIMNWKEIPKSEALNFFREITMIMGVGKYEFKKVRECYILSTHKTPFAEEFILEYGKQQSPIDYYLAGAYGTAFSSILGKPMSCEEVKCYAKGDDCCEFVVKPKEQIETKS